MDEIREKSKLNKNRRGDKRMKDKRKQIQTWLLAVLTIVCLLVLETSTASVEAKVHASANVTVSYTSDKNASFPVTVQAIGNGMLLDGNTEIRNQTNVYALEIEAEKKFVMVPDKGYKVAKITWNGTDISKTTDYVTIVGSDFEQSLCVTFEKDTSVVVTSDATKKANYEFLFIVSIFVISLLALHKQIEKQDSYNKIQY